MSMERRGEKGREGGMEEGRGKDREREKSIIQGDLEPDH